MTEHRKIPGYIHHSVLCRALRALAETPSKHGTAFELHELCDTLAADERRASERASDTALSAETLERLREALSLAEAEDGKHAGTPSRLGAFEHLLALLTYPVLHALVDNHDTTGDTARLRGQLANAERTVRFQRDALADAQVVLRAHEAEEARLCERVKQLEAALANEPDALFESGRRYEAAMSKLRPKVRDDDVDDLRAEVAYRRLMAQGVERVFDEIAAVAGFSGKAGDVEGLVERVRGISAEVEALREFRLDVARSVGCYTTIDGLPDTPGKDIDILVAVDRAAALRADCAELRALAAARAENAKLLATVERVRGVSSALAARLRPGSYEELRAYRIADELVAAALKGGEP